MIYLMASMIQRAVFKPFPKKNCLWHKVNKNIKAIQIFARITLLSHFLRYRSTSSLHLKYFRHNVNCVGAS